MAGSTFTRGHLAAAIGAAITIVIGGVVYLKDSAQPEHATTPGVVVVQGATAASSSAAPIPMASTVAPDDAVARFDRMEAIERQLHVRSARPDEDVTTAIRTKVTSVMKASYPDASIDAVTCSLHICEIQGSYKSGAGPDSNAPISIMKSSSFADAIGISGLSSVKLSSVERPDDAHMIFYAHGLYQ